MASRCNHGMAIHPSHSPSPWRRSCCITLLLEFGARASVEAALQHARAGAGRSSSRFKELTARMKADKQRNYDPKSGLPPLSRPCGTEVVLCTKPDDERLRYALAPGQFGTTVSLLVKNNSPTEIAACVSCNRITPSERPPPPVDPRRDR